jgi:hypothetical protein
MNLAIKDSRCCKLCWIKAKKLGCYKRRVAQKWDGATKELHKNPLWYIFTN